MTVTHVTVDLGNTLLKVRGWHRSADGCQRLRSADLGGGPEHLAERLAAWLAGLGEPFAAALASVAGSEVETRIAEVLVRAAEVAHVNPDPGLENRCRVPELVGRDRLWAARGALSLVGESCLVLDAGTALTVDAVQCLESGDAFLGGAIAPGPDLGARALAEWAARLPRVDPRPGVPALGRDTEEAIRAGVGVGFRGAAAELARRVAQEAGLDDPALVVTGGARAFLLTPEPLFARDPVENEDLVHLGLLTCGFEGAA